ncbi:iron-sulfur cluster assembly protein [soil metagenome]
MPTEAEILDALSGVRDPELDEPITDLKFVAGLQVSGGEVEVQLRLPTPFCAANFSYLMVADSREAVLRVPGVREARVSLDDHYAADEINAGVNGELGFDGAFPAEADGPDLEELRETFRRKSFVARQEKLCRRLLSQGYSPAELAAMTLRDLPDSEETGKYVSRRSELGLDNDTEAPFIVDPDGRAVPEDAVVSHLRRAKMNRLSIEGNAGFCRSILASRYGLSDMEEKG